MNINKEKAYTIVILVFTVLTVVFIVYATPLVHVFTPSSISEDSMFIDDFTLDSFINLYALDILKLESYELTQENREKIRTLLSSMGTINIQKFQQVLFTGNKEEMIVGIQNFMEDSFMWEEKALMVQYIIN